jgi:NADPH:quinone reductase-like Zn-dependent oxidoreductase
MFAIVKPGGRVVTIAGVPEGTGASQDLDAGPLVSALLWLASARLRRQARLHGVTYRCLFMHPSGEDLTFLARLADEWALEVVIDRVFPFGQISDAFAHLEQGRNQGEGRRPDGVTTAPQPRP